MSNPNNSNTKAPDYAKLYKEGIKTNLEFLPKQLQAELNFRNQYSPLFTQGALDLQHQFDPSLSQEQLDALNRRDPQWLAMHQSLGDKIQQALNQGYIDPRQEAAYQQLAGLAGKVSPRYEAMYRGMAGQAGKVDPRYKALYKNITDAAGKVDPRYEAAYNKLAGLAGQVDPRQEAAYRKWSQLAGEVDPRQEAAYNQWSQLAAKQAAEAGKVDPTRAAEYKALGQQVTGDTLRGTTADPATLRQMTQAIMAQRPGLSHGEAQDMATAVYVGQRGQALQQQRQQAGEQFLGQQSTEQQRQQSLALGMQGMGQFYAAPSMTQQRQQSLGQFYGAPSIMQQRQQSLGSFEQLMDPTRMSQQSLNAAGQFVDPTRMSQQSYLNSLSAIDPTRMSQQSLGQFYGMNAPEMQALGLAGTYIQPSNSVTGAINQIQGVTAPSSLQYVNPNSPSQALQFGLGNFQNQLAAGQGGSGNPWSSALSGAATGAQYGSIGGPYGAIGGALVGAGAGAFGYPQYSDAALKQNVSRTGLSTPDGIPIVEYDYQGRRWRGVLAQEVYEVRPDAVYTFPGGTLGVFYDRINATLEEVK